MSSCLSVAAHSLSEHHITTSRLEEQTGKETIWEKKPLLAQIQCDIPLKSLRVLEHGLCVSLIAIWTPGAPLSHCSGAMTISGKSSDLYVLGNRVALHAPGGGPSLIPDRPQTSATSQRLREPDIGAGRQVILLLSQKRGKSD